MNTAEARRKIAKASRNAERAGLTLPEWLEKQPWFIQDSIRTAEAKLDSDPTGGDPNRATD